MRFAIVATGSDGLLDRVITYTDIDEPRAAAERLGKERDGRMNVKALWTK
jgi:hypothetical protein